VKFEKISLTPFCKKRGVTDIDDGVCLFKHAHDVWKRGVTDINDGVCLFKHAHDVWTMVCVKILSCWQHNVSMFVGIISGKPLRDFIRPLGSLRGLKSLLHMLNAIVSPVKEDLCFILWFCFAKGIAKCKFEGIWWVTNIIYLDPLICIR
jgi:hypothetical protein